MYNRINRVLKTKHNKIILRYLDKDNLIWYCKQMSRPFFREFNDDSESIYTESDYLTFGKSYIGMLHSGYSMSSYRFVAYDYKDNTMVGGCSLFCGNNRDSIEIGYWVAPEYQGLGYGEEILDLATDISLTLEGNFKDIRLRILDINYKSIHLANKVGYERVPFISKCNKGNIYYYDINKLKYSKYRKIKNNQCERSE